MKFVSLVSMACFALMLIGCGSSPLTSTTGSKTPCSGIWCNDSMPGLRSKLDAVKSHSGYARIAFIGDSTIFGDYASVATSPGVDFCNDITTDYGYACHWDTWFGGGNYGSGTYWQADPRLSAGTGWREGGLPTIGVQSLTQTASGGPLTFAPTGTVNTFEVYYLRQPSGGVLNISVDGGTATAINTAGIASMQKAVITASSVGSHILSHVWSGGGRVDVVGDIAYDSTTPSVIVVLAAAGGATSGQLSTTTQPYSPGNSAPYSTIGVDAAIVEAGLINDWLNCPSPTTSQTNIKTLASALIDAGADVALYTPVPSNPSTGVSLETQTTFVATMKDVATDSKNTNSSSPLPVVDNFSQWGEYTNHPSWYADGAVHPNATGYQINAQAVEALIM